MTTLLITHPASLNHLNATGHPERPDRIRAIEQVLEQENFQSLVREQAPLADARDHRALPSDGLHRRKSTTPRRKKDMVQLDADTSMSPGSFEAALRAVGGATLAVDEVVGKKAANAFVAHAAARPSRRDGAADGLLHLQPGRDRCALRAEEARPAPRRRGRFRRASRQRHAGDLLERSDADVLLDAPDAALSRHRRDQRARRARQHRQRAAARRRRRRAVQGRDGERASCRGSQPSARS